MRSRSRYREHSEVSADYFAQGLVEQRASPAGQRQRALSEAASAPAGLAASGERVARGQPLHRRTAGTGGLAATRSLHQPPEHGAVLIQLLHTAAVPAVPGPPFKPHPMAVSRHRLTARFDPEPHQEAGRLEAARSGALRKARTPAGLCTSNRRAVSASPTGC